MAYLRAPRRSPFNSPCLCSGRHSSSAYQKPALKGGRRVAALKGGRRGVRLPAFNVGGQATSRSVSIVGQARRRQDSSPFFRPEGMCVTGNARVILAQKSRSMSHFAACFSPWPSDREGGIFWSALVWENKFFGRSWATPGGYRALS